MVVRHMNKSKKTASLFFLILFAISLSFGAFAQNAETVDIIKYGAEQAPVIDSSNVLINKYASNYDFSTGAAEKNPAVCLCSSSYDKIYITNTAPYDATFTLLTNIPEYANIPYSNIKVPAGQTAEILILISAGCDDSSRIEDYNVLVSNNFGTQYTIERELQINRCQSIDATLYASDNYILPCEKIKYTVELKNTASFTEQYVITPKNPQYFDNTKYEVTLEPGKKAYMNFTYAPDCSIYGQKTVSFNVESVNNKLSAKLTHDVTIEKAYGFSVSSPENLSLCRDDSKSIPIIVENKAGFENEFQFTILNKPDFVSVDQTSAKLQAGEKKEFLITAAPSKTAKSDIALDFEIKTKLGNEVYRGKINLQTKDCYAVEVSIISDTNPELCSGTYVYEVLVENKGDFKERISLSDNSDYAEVFPSTVILGSGENQTVSLSLSLPNEKTSIPFKVTATLDNGKSWGDEITIKTQKKYDCTLLAFSKEKLFARYGTENVSFKITNTGTQETTYNLKYEGDDWILLDTGSAKLQPGESSDVMLLLYSDDTEPMKKYPFKITATAENGESYEKEMVLKMTDIPLVQKLYNKATTNSCTSVSSVLLILLFLGIVAVLILAWKKVRVPFAFKIIALVLIVLVIISVLVFKGFPESKYPEIDKSLINSSNLIWYEDNSQKLDMNDYFFDPDNDTLYFSVESMPENISVEIEGAKAELTPDKDWFGNARIRFLAVDNYGGEITSQRINLEVLEVPESTCAQIYMKQCVYVNALLLILLLALVFLLKTRKEKGENSKKVAMVGVKKQKGFLYFIDKDGDVSRVPMARKDKKNQKFKKEKIGTAVVTKRK